MSVRSGVTDIILPAPLPRGGRIGISAPAGAVKAEKLAAAVKAIEGEGYHVATAPSVLNRHGLFAAPDDVRRRELEDMFSRSDVDAVFCSRGGVGSSRLLATIDTARIAGSRKPFLGFSDVTALQWLLWARERFVTFSGPLAVEWDGDISDATSEQALAILSGTTYGDLIGDLPCGSAKVLRGNGKVIGRLMPGNLTMITTLLGTPFLPDLRGCILVIEDVNEPPHRVDRLMFHLHNAGLLKGISALVVGELSAADDDESGRAIQNAILDATKESDYPIAINLPYGHGRERMTLPVGGMAEFDADNLSLKLLEPVLQERAQ